MFEVNYLSIIVSAFTALVIGYLWYGPIFGKVWEKFSKTNNLGQETILKGRVKSHVFMIIGSILMAYVLDFLIISSSYNYQPVPCPFDCFEGPWIVAPSLFSNPIIIGVYFSFLIWVGFVVPITVGSVVWEGKSWKLWFINIGYYFITLLTMGLIMGWFYAL